MKKTTLKALFFAALLFFGFHQVGWGQPLLNENFDYTIGSLLTANGWTAHSGAGTNAIDVTTGLSFAGYASSGIGGAANIDNTGEDDNKTFTAQTTGVIYAAFIIQTQSTNSAGYFFNLGASVISTNFISRVWVNATGNGVGIGTSAPATYVPITAGTPTLLVVKYDLATKISNLYVFNTFPSSEPLTPDATFTETLTLANVGSVALRQYNAAQRIIVDGIRVATTWADAVTPAVSATITLSQSTPLNGFTYVVGNGPSGEQTFTVEGTNLTNDITVTAPADYEVSLTSGTGFTTALTLTQTGGTVSTTTIHTRLKAGLSIGSYSESIDITSAGATPKSLLCNGNVTSPNPTIIVGSITGFGNQTINTISTEQSYNVTGANITGNIVVTPPAGFEISTTTGTGFSASPISLPSTGGVVNATIFVHFVPTSVTSYTGNITHTSYGATQQDVAVSGTGVNTEPTNHVTNFVAGTTTTTDIPLTWTDATGGVVPDGYLIKASPASFGDVLAPVDGVPEVNSTLVQNVAQGVGAYTFTGLNTGTPYFFKIYPYTNSGTAVNYLTTAPVPQATAITIVVPYLALYEDFNYTDPPYIGGNTAIPSSSNNWETHSGGSGTIDVLTGSLNYAGLAAPSGNKVRLPGSNATCDRDVNRALTITPNTSAVMYYSALINIVDASQLGDLVTSDYFIHFNAQSGSGASFIYGGRLAVKAVNTFANYRLSIKNTSGTGQLFTDCPTDLNFGQTYLVVVKYDRSTSPTTASLWVNPTSLGGAEPSGATVNASGDGTFLQFGSISFRNSTTTPKVDIDEVRIGTTWADVTPAGVATLATTPTSLSDFIYFVGSGPSPSQSFTITGAALSPASGSLTVTGSASYEVSADDVTFGATASIPYSVATFTSAPVFVRLKAGLVIGTYNENITVSGGGATSATVACNGTVAAMTPIIIIPGELTGFGNQVINLPSAEKTYNVSGSYLTSDITITPPVGFEISTTSGGPYVANPATITLTAVSGTVPSTPIYVVFNPTLLQPYTGNILHTSAGATNVNVAVTGTGIKGEPTNFPTLFATGTVTSTSIPLTWTDATTGEFIPDGYLIKGSAVSYAAIADPVDLVTEANSALVQDVLPGAQTFTFNSLVPGGTYYFKIFPYTNSGTAIDYKVLFAPETSAQTLPPPVTTYTWNQTVTGSWAVAENWTPTRTTPALNDILVIDGAITPSATLNSIPTQTIAQLTVINNATANLQGASVGVVLTIAGATGTDLTVATGSVLNVIGNTIFNLTVATGATASISGNMSLAGAAHKFTAADASGITFNSGATFSQGAGFSSNPFGTSTTGIANSVVFASGATYAFTLGSNPFALTAPASVVVFQTGSLYRQLASGSPSFSGRTYANVEFNVSTTFNLTGGTPMSMDNLTVNMGTVNLNLTTAALINPHSIKGNISVATGATLSFTPATAGTFSLNGTSAQTITINGTFSTGAFSTLEINNAAGVTLNNSISLLGGLKFTNGLLNIGSNNLTLGAASSITGTPSASSMIVADGSGEVRKTYSATGSFTFPVGDNTGTAEYSPVTLNFTAGTFASAYAGVNLVNAAYSGVTGNHITRYWNVTSSGITAFTCDALFNYVPADVVGTESSIYCVQMVPPTNFAVTNTTLHQLTAAGLTSFGAFTGKDPFSTSKTLILKLFLEGLYAGGGSMNQAFDGIGPHFGAGIADQITVVLYDGVGLVYTASNVDLLTNGTATITIPSNLGASYFIGIKHRNSIETASAALVSFADGTINYDFSTAASQAFGSNQITLSGGVFGFFGGDENQDGLVESGDMIDVDNAVAAFDGGYIVTDINGDGLMDSSDMIIIDNNNTAFVGATLPY